MSCQIKKSVSQKKDLLSQIKIVNWLDEEKDICFHSKYLANTKIMNAKSKGKIFNLAYFRAI